jgi:hypothetical protein
MHIDAQAYAQDFAANGGTNGVIQVADSSGFYVGCEGFVRCDDAAARVLIVAVPDATHVKVRILPDLDKDRMAEQVYGGGSDVSAYTLAKNARLYMPGQVAAIEPSFVKPSKMNI